MPPRAVTATAYVWYPDDGNIGHSSLHIGSHKEMNDTTWYVSWWPNATAGFTDKHPSAPKDLNGDIAAEGARAHVRYELYNLDVTAMKAEWDSIRTKPNAHYQLLAKNCSTIVARVMREGGAADKLSLLKAASYAHNLYWTPKNVAEFCDQLVSAGYGTKFKDHHCPTKRDNKAFVLFGLR